MRIAPGFTLALFWEVTVDLFFFLNFRQYLGKVSVRLFVWVSFQLLDLLDGRYCIRIFLARLMLVSLFTAGNPFQMVKVFS